MHTEYPISPYVKVGGLVYFARMLSKIRLHAAGQLAEDYLANLGVGFDGWCLQFLQVEYEDIKQRVLEGGTDAEILQWAIAQGRGAKPSDEEIYSWNSFMVKSGWRDESSERLQIRIRQYLPECRLKVETFFDFIEVDEHRLPPVRWWE